MAELFGTVASAVAVAELFTKSALKIKKIWDEVKEIPDDIKRLLKQLDEVRSILDTVAAASMQHQYLIHGSATASVLESCRELVDGLGVLAEDWHGQITTAKRSRRTLTKLKITFKKDMIQDYQRKLDSIFQRLSVSLSTTSVFMLMSMQRQMLSMEAQVSEQLAQSLLNQTSHQNRFSDGFQSDLPELLSNDSSVVLGEEPDEDGVIEVQRQRPRGKQNPTPIPYQRASFFGSFTYRTSSGPASRGIQTRQIRVQLPRWLSEKAWDFQTIYNPCTGWKSSLTPWVTRQWDSPIFDLILEGSWPAIYQHLTDGHASLWDRDEDGRTLLDLALEEGHVDVARNLLDMGLYLTDSSFGEGSNLSRTMLHWAWKACPSATLLDSFRLLLAAGDFEESIQRLFRPTIDWGSGLMYIAWLLPGCLPLLASEGQVIFDQLSISARFSSLNWSFVNPELLLRTIRHSGCSPAQFRQEVMGSVRSSMCEFVGFYFEKSLRHTTSRFAGPRSTRLDTAMEEDNFLNLRELARWLLTDISVSELGSVAEDVFANHPRATPFLMAIWAHEVHNWSARRSPHAPKSQRLLLPRLTQTLSFWLEDIECSGIDIVEYGKRELRTLVRHPRLRRFRSCRWFMLERWEYERNLRVRKMYGPRLVSFTYGPRAEDWTFVWDPATEEFARDFWHMVENPRLHVPGEWLSDSDDSDDSDSSSEFQEYDSYYDSDGSDAALTPDWSDYESESD